MADKRRKHSGKNHLTREGWKRLNSAAFCRKVARYSTWPEGENGGVIIVEHIDPRCYPRIEPQSWQAIQKRERESS
jgi:hypothetical protein